MKARVHSKYLNEVYRGIICKGKYLRHILGALARPDMLPPTVIDTAKYAVSIGNIEYDDEYGYSEPYIRVQMISAFPDDPDYCYYGGYHFK